MGRLTEAQADLLRRMGEAPNVLRQDDECRPSCWLEGGKTVRRSVFDACVRRGYVRLTGHEGGWPGMDLFTRTPAGRAALDAEGRDANPTINRKETTDVGR